MTDRIFLSPPHVSIRERELLLDAFDSNWIAPLGPHVDGFEREFSEFLGVGDAVALSSGTAALHLALVLLGVSQGDHVFAPTFTFVASANPIRYVGATPVFVDCDASTWNMDPELLIEALEEADRAGNLPKAVIVVDLYGQCADYDRIRSACDAYEVPVIEDAAAALGATYGERCAGTLGDIGIVSFNGNKLITTSGGGMLVAAQEELIDRCRFLATQARDPAPHYEHSVVGFNYRLSNLLAALGRGQLEGVEGKIAMRRQANEFYRQALRDVGGIEFMPIAEYGEWNYWLTCITIDPELCGCDFEILRNHLELDNIEARPVWKPLHLQPLYRDCHVVGGSVSESLFTRGLCLPSGSALTPEQLERVVTGIRAAVHTC